jgi:photosystem II stability/assembly factor-like uncharacterized protein
MRLEFKNVYLSIRSGAALSFVFFAVLGFYCIPLNAQWTPLSSGTTSTLNSVYFYNESVGVSVGENSTALKSTDGTNWTAITIAGSESFSCVTMTNDSTLFVTGLFGIYKSTDTGDSWVLTPCSEIMRSIFFIDETVGYVCGDNSTLYKTVDGGMNWVPLLFPTSGLVLKRVYSLSSDTLYILSNNSNDAVMRSYDGGQTWFSFPVPVTSTWDDIVFTNANNGYLVSGSGSAVLTTFNSGLSWSYNSQGGQHNYCLEFISTAVGYAAGGLPFSYGGIEMTSDSGNTWLPSNATSMGVFLDICFPNDTIGYAVGQYGTILKTTNGGAVGFNEETSDSEVEFYPNPSRGLLLISYNSSSNCEITVTDLQGVVVERQKNVLTQSEIDLSNLKSGLYIITFKTDSGTQIEPLIIYD